MSTVEWCDNWIWYTGCWLMDLEQQPTASATAETGTSFAQWSYFRTTYPKQHMSTTSRYNLFVFRCEIFL